MLVVGRSKDDQLRKLMACCPTNHHWFALADVLPAALLELGMQGVGALATLCAVGGAIGWALLDEG